MVSEVSGKYPIPRCRQCGAPRYDAHSRQNGLCKECKVKVRRAYMRVYMRGYPTGGPSPPPQ
jgi:hypothetical protein